MRSVTERGFLSGGRKRERGDWAAAAVAGLGKRVPLRPARGEEGLRKDLRGLPRGLGGAGGGSLLGEVAEGVEGWSFRVAGLVLGEETEGGLEVEFRVVARGWP